MTLIIAHRGASAHAPENTLAAFTLAHTQGADMIEIDVRRSADGVLVVVHDETTERWNGQQHPIHTCSLAELRALNSGGEQMPTLSETCALACDLGIGLNIDIKQQGIAGDIVMMIHAYRIQKHVLIASFNAADLLKVQRHAPHVSCAFLMGTRSYHPRTRARELWPFLHLRHVRASAWHPAYNLPLLRHVLPLVRRAGYRVNVWTIDEPLHIRQCVAWGATGIITNDPARARAALAEPG